MMSENCAGVNILIFFWFSTKGVEKLYERSILNLRDIKSTKYRSKHRNKITSSHFDFFFVGWKYMGRNGSVGKRPIYFFQDEVVEIVVLTLIRSVCRCRLVVRRVF